MIPKGTLESFETLMNKHKKKCKKLAKNDPTHLYIDITNEELESHGVVLRYPQPIYDFKDLETLFQKKQAPITDVNLLLGRLDSRRFDIPIDVAAARRACDETMNEIEKHTGERPPTETLLEGLCDIANERMADAIRRISIRKGYDPADYGLVAFGGAGGQHGCAVAERLGISKIVIPRDVSLLSAVGLGHAAIEQFAERQVLRLLDEALPNVPGWIDELAREANAALERTGVPRGRSEIRRRIVNLRFAGQDSVLHIDYDDETPLRNAFEDKYRKIFGHWQKHRPIEIESIRVVASSRPEEAVGDGDSPVSIGTGRKNPRRVRAWFGRWCDTDAHERDNLPVGARVAGPAQITPCARKQRSGSSSTWCGRFHSLTRGGVSENSVAYVASGSISLASLSRGSCYR